MGLWIRSQNKKKLLEAETLFVCDSDELNKHSVCVYFSQSLQRGAFCLGTYNSEKRALEVLDEIHQRLINLETLEIAPDSYRMLPKNTSNVYEMPKE